MSAASDTSRTERDIERERDRTFDRYLQIGAPVATLLGSVVAYSVQGPPGVIVVLAGGALVGAIAAFWSSIRTLAGETPLSGADAYAIGAPSTEEEQKRAVLRALKDLEFERSVGKISDDDYRALAARYRDEAKRLLRILDKREDPQRERVEALLRERLRREGMGADITESPSTKASTAADVPSPVKPVAARKGSKARRPQGSSEARAVTSGTTASAASPQVACPKCSKLNESDAVFCNKCGGRIAAEVSGDDGQNDEEA